MLPNPPSLAGRPSTTPAACLPEHNQEDPELLTNSPSDAVRIRSDQTGPERRRLPAIRKTEAPLDSAIIN